MAAKRWHRTAFMAMFAVGVHHGPAATHTNWHPSLVAQAAWARAAQRRVVDAWQATDVTAGYEPELQGLRVKWAQLGVGDVSFRHP